MLSVEHLTVAYGARMALEDVTFHLEPGTVLGVIGPNGAGKSTLIRALTGVVHPQHGRIVVAGRELNGLTPIERARRMAVVPQARQLPPAFTAWETVLLGRTPHLNWLGQTSAKDDAATRQAMERTHTLHLAERKVGELSGGEQQRLLLARALAQAAPVLLLDEPTTHLDLQHQLSMLEQVIEQVHIRSNGSPPQRAAVVVLHDLNLVARYADRVALIVAGRLRAFGEPPAVLDRHLLSDAYHVSLQVLSPGPCGYPVIVPGPR